MTIRDEDSDRSVELPRAEALELVERVRRRESWQNAINGCVVGRGVTVSIARGDGAPLRLWTSCGNVHLLGDDAAAEPGDREATSGTWARPMTAWFAEVCARSGLACR